MSEVETPRLTISAEPFSVQQRHPQPERLAPCSGTGHHSFYSIGEFGVVEHPPDTECTCGERLIGEALEYYIEARHIYQDGRQAGWLLVSLATDRT